MNNATETAGTTIRCMDCGRKNAARESTCEFCGATLRSNQQSFTDLPGNNGAGTLPSLPPPLSPDSAVSTPFPFTGPLTRPLSAENSTSAQIEDQRVASAELNGRVIAADPVLHEQPDFDWCRMATRLLWFLLLVVSPFILLRTVLVQLGALPVVFAVVGFLFLLRFFSPTSMLSLLQLHMILNPLRRLEAEQVPVRYFRVRDAHEREWIVRMKGQVNGGNIAPDDLISAWGKWRGGTLSLSRGYNHRTQSHVLVRSSQSWMMLAVTVGVILLLGIYFYRPLHAMWQMMHSVGGPR
jgi:hypothetical protein